MPCHRTGEKITRQPSLQGRLTALFAALAILAPAGCGGQLGNDEPAPSPESTSPPGAKLLAALLSMKPTGVAGGQNAATERHIFCPEVRVLDGTEASRAYAGTPPSSANLRYQYALTDTARECALDGDQLALKIGVAGKVLLGPAGSAGSFTVPVRMAIFRKGDNNPVVSKLYHASVNVGQSDFEAQFTIVSEPLHVPFIEEHSEQDYMIKVGFDEGKTAGEHPRKEGKH